MKQFTDNVKYLSNVALAAGVLAIVPLSASAMVTDHDTMEATPDSGITINKQVSGDMNDALANRFGTYSGFGVRGSGSVEVQSGTEDPGGAGQPAGRRDLYLQLP